MSAARKILIVDRAAPSLARDLQAHGFACDTRLDLTYDEFRRLPDELYGLVIRSRFQVDRQLIDSKSQLRFIARLGSGVENIDTAYAESRGIACLSTPEGNANAVAEHALGLLLGAAFAHNFGLASSAAGPTGHGKIAVIIGIIVVIVIGEFNIRSGKKKG